MLLEHRLGIGAAHQACQRLHGRRSENRLCVFPRHSQQRVNAPCRSTKGACRLQIVKSQSSKSSATGLCSTCSLQHAIPSSHSGCLTLASGRHIQLKPCTDVTS